MAAKKRKRRKIKGMDGFYFTLGENGETIRFLRLLRFFAAKQLRLSGSCAFVGEDTTEVCGVAGGGVYEPGNRRWAEPRTTRTTRNQSGATTVSGHASLPPNR